MNAAAKRVLVTGASGFVGRQAVAALRSSGFEVVAVSSHERVGRARCRLEAMRLARRCANRAPPRRGSPDSSLHLAWCTEAGKYWESPENPPWLDATRTIARAFGSIGGRRFVGAGSCAEYDWTVGDGICRETSTPLRPCFTVRALQGCGSRCRRVGGARVQASLPRGDDFSISTGHSSIRRGWFLR